MSSGARFRSMTTPSTERVLSEAADATGWRGPWFDAASPEMARTARGRLRPVTVILWYDWRRRAHFAPANRPAVANRLAPPARPAVPCSLPHHPRL